MLVEKSLWSYARPFRRALVSLGPDHNNHVPQHSTHSTHEGFGTPFWRNVLLATLLGVGLYKYAPEPSDDVYLSRWVAMYTLPREHWLDLNSKHTVLSQSVSDEILLFRDAKRPQVHRYRYPQILDQCSPFLTPIGMNVDMGNVVVKGDKDV